MRGSVLALAWAKMRAGVVLVWFMLAGCGRTSAAPSPIPSVAPAPAEAPRDVELDACRSRLASFATEAELPGAPAIDEARIEILGLSLIHI